ncbi:NAD(P)/FAD-dependent oxidoreductase [Streptomyces sp. NPDC005438]|uniref:dihydrolipoyl dehydrogenase family protein n=1 Tax=Streptomyces sp. NPDC005438 TaxID=3156880 RepID=UPI0033B42497
MTAQHTGPSPGGAGTEEVDVVVLGMGPGGEQVAGSLAEAGWDVVGVEAELVGGECPYWACVPSKMMIRAGNALAEAHRVGQLAGTARVYSDWEPVATRIREEATTDWDDQIAADRFRGKGGRLLRGRGRLVGPGRVRVGERTLAARHGVVLATGTEPAVPPVPGLRDTPYWTNRQAVSATTPPGSLLVLGGGAIGVELAQAFARFGTSTTVVESAPSLLPAEEPEVGAVLEEVLREERIEVRTGSRAVGVEHDGKAFALTLDNGERLVADRLLVATGRRARLADVGLETVGLDPETRLLETDGRMRAGDGLWAVGDVTEHGGFTHMALYQADIAVRTLLGQDGPPADYRAAPRVTFCDPEVGAVGLTERQARDRGLDVRTGSADLPSVARGWIHRTGNEGLIKLVADADRGLLVGATSMGPMGGEVLYGLAVAVRAELPVELLRDLPFAYPTFHRGVEDALDDLVSSG